MSVLQRQAAATILLQKEKAVSLTSTFEATRKMITHSWEECTTVRLLWDLIEEYDQAGAADSMRTVLAAVRQRVAREGVPLPTKDFVKQQVTQVYLARMFSSRRMHVDPELRRNPTFVRQLEEARSKYAQTVLAQQAESLRDVSGGLVPSASNRHWGTEKVHRFHVAKTMVAASAAANAINPVSAGLGPLGSRLNPNFHGPRIASSAIEPMVYAVRDATMGIKKSPTKNKVSPTHPEAQARHRDLHPRHNGSMDPENQPRKGFALPPSEARKARRKVVIAGAQSDIAEDLKKLFEMKDLSLAFLADAQGASPGVVRAGKFTKKNVASTNKLKIESVREPSNNDLVPSCKCSVDHKTLVEEALKALGLSTASADKTFDRRSTKAWRSTPTIL